MSPFVPAILFTTDAGIEVDTVTQSLTSLSLSADKATADAGDIVQLTASLTGTLTPSSSTIQLAPEACVYKLSATESAGGSSLQLPSTTYVDEYARLHLGKSLKSGNVIKVDATSTYVNPSGETASLSADTSVTIN